MNANKKGEKYERRIAEYFAAPVVNVPMKLKFVRVIGDLFIFHIKFVPGTTESKIRNHLENAQQTLRLQLFQLHRENMDLFLVVSECKEFNNYLLGILTSPSYQMFTKDMVIPFPVGFNVMRRPVIVDLVAYKNWFLGGGNSSGKTTSLQSLITSIIWSCSPEKVNLIVIDIVLNLTQFKGLPHFCCDVISDANAGIKAIMKLRMEMDRRFTIREEDITEFNKLPIIVCVIEELVSFVSRAGSKEAMKSLSDIISLLIRTGRHAGIYMVLTTQNPVVDDLKCDISSITSRLAFAVAKPINSVTIIGEGGAEKISEMGECISYLINTKVLNI
jgi:DNA segregation ATPase FtsK/SpoIIIE-like protein